MLFSKKITPELISLHIPKTAGTSFRNILKNVYGDKQVVRVDINEIGVIRINEKIIETNELPSAKVIHGHFSIEALKSKFVMPDEYRLITWMRDPVKRVISNYYYLELRLQELMMEDVVKLNMLKKMQRSLIEYARVDENRNRQSKFLKGAHINEFDFIGIHEAFSKEIPRLAKIMNWKQIPDVLFQNKTESVENTISNEILEEIKELNLIDVDLYNQALQIRDKSS